MGLKPLLLCLQRIYIVWYDYLLRPSVPSLQQMTCSNRCHFDFCDVIWLLWCDFHLNDKSWMRGSGLRVCFRLSLSWTFERTTWSDWALSKVWYYESMAGYNNVAICCLSVTYGMTSSNTYYYTKVMTDLFVLTPSGSGVTFQSISSMADFWTVRTLPALTLLKYWTVWHQLVLMKLLWSLIAQRWHKSISDIKIS